MDACRELLLTRADECERLAALAASDDARRRFLALARYWLVLAGEIAESEPAGCVPAWSIAPSATGREQASADAAAAEEAA